MNVSNYRHIDPGVLLLSVASDMGAFRDLARTYLRVAPPMLERLARAMAARNPDAAVRESHALKGTAALVGAVHLTHLAACMELHGRNGDIAGARRHLGELEQEFERAITEVRLAIEHFDGTC